MSQSGAPAVTVEQTWSELALGNQARVAVVAASWHDEIMAGLIAGAQRVLEQAGAPWDLIRVPGSFELPVVTQSYLTDGPMTLADRETANPAKPNNRPWYAAAVALGVIVRGGTPHFDYVAQATSLGLTQVALTCGKPVGFGLLTTDNLDQAIDRAGLPSSSEDKGGEAAAAVLAALAACRR
ncbi:MAG: 6,7-dimethyl-8-ribityllumazine synthase [Propionibacteriaceae bacterium]|jgi:6,7-dimethyl-8-ribityllumazine synthase|nr:6,7-dimethyl-8-ribityllumazine synthase [Propionibacteriaceae bacterium]